MATVGELRVESGSVLSLAPSGTLYLGLMGPGDAIFDHAGGATMGSLRIGGSEAGSAGSIVARASLLEPGLLAVSPRPDALPELQLEAGGRIACQTGSLGHGVDIVAEVALDAPPLIAASEWLYVAGSLHLTFPDGPPRPNTWHTLFAAPTYVGIPSLETEPPGAGIVLWQPGRLAFFAPPPTSMLTIAPSAISLGVGQGAALATSLDTGSETLDVTWVTGWSVDPPSLASVAGSIPTIIGLTPGVGTLTASLSNGMHASAAISVAPSGLPASPSRRLSLPSTSEAFAASIEPRVSPDGRYVSFSTWALSLGALSTGTHEVVVLDRLVGTTELVSVHATIPPPWGGWSVGAWPSDAAQRIAFTSSAASITGESGLEGPHPYLRDRVNGTTLRLDQRIDGTIPTGSGAVRGISDDGFRILFDSNDPLLVEGDAGETWDVFLADVERGTLQRISLPAPGVPSTPGATSRAIALAADGSTILFASTAALVADDTNGVPDLYLFEASAGSLERIGDGWPSEDLDAVAEQATLSPDGSTIALATTRQLLPNDSDQLSDLYVYRRDTAALTLPIPEAVATEPFHPQLSPDGTSIAFVTESPLTTSDTNGAPDVYRAMAPDWWPEPIALGFGDSIANSGARSPFLLRDGSGIPFQSNSTNLAIPDNAAPDVYLRGLAAASGDLDGDRDVDSADLALLLGAWGSTTGDLADLDGDGVVGGADLVLLLEQWTL